MKMLDRAAGDSIELASFWGEQKPGALRLFLVEGRPVNCFGRDQKSRGIACKMLFPRSTCAFYKGAESH